MNKLIITLATALALGTAAFAVEPAELSVRERKDAERCGIAVEQWKTMTKKARKEAKQEAKAKALGMTVAEMKAANNKKAAEKAEAEKAAAEKPKAESASRPANGKG